MIEKIEIMQWIYDNHKIEPKMWCGFYWSDDNKTYYSYSDSQNSECHLPWYPLEQVLSELPLEDIVKAIAEARKTATTGEPRLYDNNGCEVMYLVSDIDYHLFALRQLKKVINVEEKQ